MLGKSSIAKREFPWQGSSGAGAVAVGRRSRHATALLVGGGIAVLVVADRSALGYYGGGRRHQNRDELAMTGTVAFDRITFEPGKMGGRACIRRMRITVSTIVGLVAEGETAAEILATWPDLVF